MFIFFKQIVSKSDIRNSKNLQPNISAYSVPVTKGCICLSKLYNLQQILKRSAPYKMFEMNTALGNKLL